MRTDHDQSRDAGIAARAPGQEPRRHDTDGRPQRVCRDGTTDRRDALSTSRPRERVPDYALRQQIDLMMGGLLVLMVMGGCVALGFTQRQRTEAALIEALHEQERLAFAIVHQGDACIAIAGRHDAIDHDRLVSFRRDVTRLHRNLLILSHGGGLLSSQGTFLRVSPWADPVTAHQLQAAMKWLERYQRSIETLITVVNDRGDHASTLIQGVSDERQLLLILQSMASTAESRFQVEVVRVSGVHLALMIAGLLYFFLGVWLLHRFVTVPLRRLVDHIELTRRVGRVCHLPGFPRNEFGVVASAFNRLVERADDQSQQLREQLRELQRVSEELDQLANLKDEFLTNINHQLRTPLTAIVEGLDLIRDGVVGPMNESLRDHVETMATSTRQLWGLIEDILDLSLLQSGRRVLKRKPMDLGTLLQQCCAEWRGAAQSRTIQLVGDTLPLVYADEQAIREVLNHLLGNALQHAPERSLITIVGKVCDAVVEVAVSDQGPGMSPHQLRRLFQPFVHLHTPEAPGSEGNGLGLALCRQVVERHHGSIRAMSVPGQGTTVLFCLPIHSVRRLFEEACGVAQERAAQREGQFGLLVVTPAASTSSAGWGERLNSVPVIPPNPPGEVPLEFMGVGAAVNPVLSDAHALLRRQTHQRDQFVWLSERMFAVIVVTNAAGVAAVATRLQSFLRQATLDVRLGVAVFPRDGTIPTGLLRVACERAQRGDSPTPVSCVTTGEPGTGVSPVVSTDISRSRTQRYRALGLGDGDSRAFGDVGGGGVLDG